VLAAADAEWDAAVWAAIVERMDSAAIAKQGDLLAAQGDRHGPLTQLA
jgi:hypothetical protein